MVGSTGGDLEWVFFRDWWERAAQPCWVVTFEAVSEPRPGQLL